MQIDNKVAVIVIVVVLAIFLWVANNKMNDTSGVDSGNLPTTMDAGIVLPR